MLDTLESPGAVKERFVRITREIERLIQANRPRQIIEASQRYLGQYGVESSAKLVLGLNYYITNQYPETIASFAEAGRDLQWQDYPEDKSIYSQAFLQAQLASGAGVFQATEAAQGCFQANLAALREVNGSLAAALAEAVMPAYYRFVRFWGGLHLLDDRTAQLMTMNRTVGTRLLEALTMPDRVQSIGVAGLNTGQELKFCVAWRQPELHGRSMPLLVLAPVLADLRLLLSLADYGEPLRQGSLLLFGGGDIQAQVAAVFNTLRYRAPDYWIGSLETARFCFGSVAPVEAAAGVAERLNNYYRSEWFKQRQRDIAAGRIKPRVMIATCRWTTFLKYCAADFKKAFEQLGCQTRFLIEENDIQRLNDCLQLRELEQFKPDVYFMVSFARTAMFDGFPRDLPFIAFLQDRCDPLWRAPERDLSRRFAARDLLVCLVREYQDYLTARRVPDWQTMIMPVPVDPAMFYPLAENHPLAGRFGCEVSYVKHGGADTEALLNQWMRDNRLDSATGPLAPLKGYFRQWYDLFLAQPGRSWPERMLHEDLDKNLTAQISDHDRTVLHQMVSQFATTVYTGCRRRYYLESFLETGLALKLYGNGWDIDRRFARYAGGLVQRDRDLIGVYNFSKINLHMQPYISMHQRVVECALSGGFMMIADLPAEEDWSRARDYFEEGREVVFFGRREDMIDKCRYYLDHERERREIAARFRQRALRQHTVVRAADGILARWRQLLNHSLLQPAGVCV